MESSLNSSGEFHKTLPIIRDFKLNPSCQHGPTILFDRNGTRFFACSAYRDKKLCSFQMFENAWKVNSPNTDDILDGYCDDDHIPKKKSKLNASHTTSNLPCPLQTPNQRDKGEAQYHFTEETVQFFIQQFKNLGLTHVLCIGAPSLHECIRNTKQNQEQPQLKSFLLDFDQRLIQKYKKNECAHYNMCNHHFFEGRKSFDKFLNSAESLAIVTDPPFGVKVELIWNGGLKCCRDDFYRFHGLTSRCEIFWIFPYFNEGHILSKCPDSELKMSDYKVMYKNHKKFGKTQNKSSPVRIFTTAPLSELKLPEEQYRFCNLCNKWVDQKNTHCSTCNKCSTKDGGNSYIHCDKCQICVKPTWIHCQYPCARCHLKDSECLSSSTNNGRTKFKQQYKNKKNNKKQKYRK